MEKKREGYLNEYDPLLNKEDILNELRDKKDVVVITTYQSSYKLLDSCKELKFKFDLGIFDEAHRSVGEAYKQFTQLLSDKYNISKKRLFMTATEKIYNYSKSNMMNADDQVKILSMNDEKIYGKKIYIYSLRQAIEDNALVDYNIIATFISLDKYQDLLTNNSLIKNLNDKEIYNSKQICISLMILHTMITYKYTHLLIFSNKNKSAENIIYIIQKLAPLFFKDNEDVYYKYLSGSDNMKIRKSEVAKFEKAKLGIISSARIFNEGVNIKICDAICFADNKESSTDIIQCVGRCLRKYKNNPNKLAHVIIPFFCDMQENFFDSGNDSYKKIRLILNSIASTDDMVSDKFNIVPGNDVVISKSNSINIINNKSVKKIDLNEFKKNICSKIFDKSGNPYPRLRKSINRKNSELFNNDEKLIDTKSQCIDFIKKEGYPVPKKNINKDNNWIRWALGDILYNKITTIFYKKEELIEACRRMGIDDMESYKKNQMKEMEVRDFIYFWLKYTIYSNMPFD